jgi:hypothetical protein
VKISAVLEQALQLISQPGAHSKRAFARAAEFEAVHALHPSAISWDSTGAIQKIVGELESPTVTAALGCLGVGALKSCKKGIVEINDDGTPAEFRRMWLVAIASAKEVESWFTAGVTAA